MAWGEVQPLGRLPPLRGARLRPRGDGRSWPRTSVGRPSAGHPRAARNLGSESHGDRARVGLEYEVYSAGHVAERDRVRQMEERLFGISLHECPGVRVPVPRPRIDRLWRLRVRQLMGCFRAYIRPDADIRAETLDKCGLGGGQGILDGLRQGLRFRCGVAEVPGIVKKRYVREVTPLPVVNPGPSTYSMLTAQVASSPCLGLNGSFLSSARRTSPGTPGRPRYLTGIDRTGACALGSESPSCSLALLPKEGNRNVISPLAQSANAAEQRTPNTPSTVNDTRLVAEAGACGLSEPCASRTPKGRIRKVSAMIEEGSFMFSPREVGVGWGIECDACLATADDRTLIRFARR